MNVKALTTKDEMVLFGAGVIIFLTASVLGWIKLRYGFNFIDEGYHMTESWRLTAGDHFLRDKFTGALRHYTLINALIFNAVPDITLLGFRKLQFILTIIMLASLGLAVARLYREYWHLPLIFSVFAFTGLDPIGIIPNLCYQTYPHLFMGFFLACFLFGLGSSSKVLRSILFFISGAFLAALSLSVFHMSTVMAAPVILFGLTFFIRDERYSFSFKELLVTLAPFFLFWGIFLGIYGNEYLINLKESVLLMLSSPTHEAGALIRFDRNVMAIAGISLASILAVCLIIRLKSLSLVLGLLSVFCGFSFFAIQTSFFHVISTGLFDVPLCCAIYLIVFQTVFWAWILWKLIRKEELSSAGKVCILLMVPATILSATTSIFSGLGVMSVLHAAIPVATAMGIWAVENAQAKTFPKPAIALILVLVMGSFYVNLSWSDWNNTFFDVPPAQMDAVIDKGFAQGIRTNQLYRSVYNWIDDISGRYSEKDDYLISYVVSPMVHMIAKRKPALDESYIDFSEVPGDYYMKAIEVMKKKHRNPRLVFLYDRMFCLFPVAGDPGAVTWLGQQVTPQSQDPVSLYVKDNMYLLDRFPVDKDLTILCFIDNPVDPVILNLEKTVKGSPDSRELTRQLGELYTRKGDFYVSRKDYRPAFAAYNKAQSYIADSVDLLNKLGRLGARTGRETEAVAAFEKVVRIQPDQADGFYNLACMYSRIKKEKEALQALRNAVARGFHDCGLLKEDQDLVNIRLSAGFREILSARCP